MFNRADYSARPKLWGKGFVAHVGEWPSGICILRGDLVANRAFGERYQTLFRHADCNSAATIPADLAIKICRVRFMCVSKLCSESNRYEACDRCTNKVGRRACVQRPGIQRACVYE